MKSTADTGLIRVWAAVWDDTQNKPIAAIQDVKTWQGMGDAGFRVWQAQAWCGPMPRGGFGRHNKGCSDKAPCSYCNKTAAKWWYEWEKKQGVK